MKLPIDVIANTNPPRFVWRQLTPTMDGLRVVECDGTLPPSVEGAVVALVALVKQQAQEIAGLQKQIEGHAERIAAQSELLSKKAEAAQPKRGK